MVIESRISNGSDAVSLTLVPCAKSNGNSCVNGDEKNTIEMVSVNGVETCNPKRHSQSSVPEYASIGLEGAQSTDKVLIRCKMVIDSRISNDGDAVSFSLVPCAKSNGNSPGSGYENNSHKTEMVLVNGVQSYKRQRQSWSRSEDNMPEDASIALEAGQLMEKDSDNEHMGSISDGSCTNDQPNAHVVSEPGQSVFHDVIVAEKYDTLCKLLSKSFQGIVKVESFSDFNTINSRMRDGAYSHSPQLFLKDVEQIGLKFQKIGAEMVSLVEGLSDMSRKLYSEQVVGSANGTCVEEKHMETNEIHAGNMDCLDLGTRKPSSPETDQHCKPDQGGLDKSYVCNCCKGKTDDRICIVCDSCEKMYHVFCVGISVSKNSPRSWYCMNCVRAGLGSLHENCVVCDRASNSISCSMTHGMLSSMDQNSNCCREADVIQQSSERTSSQTCKLCRCEFEDIQYQECEHSLCLNKFHTRCLTDLELKRFGPRWYCPSCLCRVCLLDQDDEKIVLCDGCDNAYHIYCMEPPRSSIPDGKWYCRVCDIRFEAIRKAKRLYEKHQRKGNTGGVISVVEPVDMLLSAAEELEK